MELTLERFDTCREQLSFVILFLLPVVFDKQLRVLFEGFKLTARANAVDNHLVELLRRKASKQRWKVASSWYSSIRLVLVTNWIPAAPVWHFHARPGHVPYINQFLLDCSEISHWRWALVMHDCMSFSPKFLIVVDWLFKQLSLTFVEIGGGAATLFAFVDGFGIAHNRKWISNAFMVVALGCRNNLCSIIIRLEILRLDWLTHCNRECLMWLELGFLVERALLRANLNRLPACRGQVCSLIVLLSIPGN